ncbi:GSCOCG00009076001-RA-CDS [Cotesia congregata]|nr:GSCOCG00009076001-RA-CDS [Cotesia congregata]
MSCRCCNQLGIFLWSKSELLLRLVRASVLRRWWSSLPRWSLPRTRSGLNPTTTRLLILGSNFATPIAPRLLYAALGLGSSSSELLRILEVARSNLGMLFEAGSLDLVPQVRSNFALLLMYPV